MKTTMKIKTHNFRQLKIWEDPIELAIGSSYELESQLIIAYNLNYLEENTYNKLLLKITNLQNMIGGFKRSIMNTYDEKVLNPEILKS